MKKYNKKDKKEEKEEEEEEKGEYDIVFVNNPEINKSIERLRNVIDPSCTRCKIEMLVLIYKRFSVCLLTVF